MCLWNAKTGAEIHRLQADASEKPPQYPLDAAELSHVTFSPDGKRLAVVRGDKDAPVELPAKALESCWTDLAGDATKAYRAIAALTATPPQATSLLRERLHPAAAPDDRHIARLIADLDSEEFALRQKAAAELEKVAELVEPALRKALSNNPSTETQRRLDALLKQLSDGGLPPAGLRDLRALEVLEHLGTPEARQLLQDLAKGLAHARLTREAKATLERLANRAK